MKLLYTREQVEEIKNKIYLTDEEEKVFDMWLRDCSIIETSMKLNISPTTVTRRRTMIMKKIKLIKNV